MQSLHELGFLAAQAATRHQLLARRAAPGKPDGDLVWTGVSESFNPKSAKKVADGLVREVPKQMEKDGLLPKKPSPK